MANVDFLRLQGLGRNLKYKIIGVGLLVGLVLLVALVLLVILAALELQVPEGFRIVLIWP